MSKVVHQDNVSEYKKFSLEQGARLYAELRKEIINHGLLNRSYGYYSILTLFTYLGFFSSLIGIYYTNNPVFIIFLSVTFALCSVQVAGLIHDAAHRAIFNSPKINDYFGKFLAFTVATGYGNWKVSHDRHHANPNQEGFDPDVEVPFSFTPERIKNSKGLARKIAKNQAYLYYPLGVFTSLSLRFKKMSYFQENWGPKVYPEFSLFVISIILHFGIPILFFGPIKGLIFLLIVTMVEGFYLFNVFAPNHKGMPELGDDVKFSFLEHQIITARNIPHNDFVDFVYLGLNLQIEHHLFPNSPRNNLYKIAKYVKKFCKEHKLDYTEAGVIESNLIIFNEMRKISDEYARIY